MDPNEALRKALSLAKRIVEMSEAMAGLEEGDVEAETLAVDMADLAGEGGELAQAVLDLDGWIVGGGFLPSRWRKVQG